MMSVDLLRKVTKIRITNWHACADSGCINIYDDAMMAGKTGVGKSTLIDALYSTLFVNNNNLNKAANESSKRDIRGYVRYQINAKDENNKVVKYLRKGRVISYVSIEIIGRKGEPIVLGVCYTSPSEFAQVENEYFVIFNKKLEEINTLDDERRPLEFKDFKRRYESTGIKTEDTQKRARKLFAATLGFEDNVDVFEKVGNAVSRVMASKADSLKDIEKYVRLEILPPRALNVDEDKELADSLRDMQEHLNELQTRSLNLSSITGQMEAIEAKQKEKTQNEILRTIAIYTTSQQEVEKLSEELEYSEDVVAGHKKQIENIEKVIEEHRNSISKLKNSEAAKLIDERRKEKEIRENELKKAKHMARKASNALGDLQAEIDNSDLCNFNLAQFVINEFTTDAIVEDYKTELRKFSDDIVLMNGKLAVQQHALEDEKSRLHNENQRMRTGSIADKKYIDAINAINYAFDNKGIDDEAKMLFQTIEFKQEYESWQEVIETKMGNTRFYILVKPENYQTAIETIYNRKLYFATIIDTSELEEFENVEEGSVCNLMLYQNEYARRYMNYRYGKIMAVETCVNTDLNKRGSYLGKDGTVYNAHAFTLTQKDTRCYIGQEARKRLIEQNNQRIREIDTQIGDVKNNLLELYKIKNRTTDAIERVTLVRKETLDCLSECPRKIVALENEIAELVAIHNMEDANRRVEILEQEIVTLRAKKNEIDEKKTEQAKKSGVISDRLRNATAKFNAEEPRYEDYKVNKPDSFEMAIAEYEKMMSDKRKTVASVAETAKKMCDDLTGQIMQSNGELIQCQKEYNRVYDNSAPVNGIADLEWYAIEHQKIVISQLPDTQTSVNKTRERFVERIKTTTIEHFISCISEAEELRKDMNNVLKTARYGNTTYSLDPIRPNNGFEHYYDFIKKLMDADEDELKTITSEDYEEFYRAIEKNDNYKDYRNFLRIGVTTHIKNSDGSVLRQNLADSFSVGSGGQTEIPFYILSAMALISAYSSEIKDLRGKAGPMKLLIIDEAFSKMDNQTVESMMGFFHTLGFQVILSAPESKNDIILPHVKTCIIPINTAKGRGFRSVANGVGGRNFVTVRQIVEEIQKNDSDSIDEE